MGEAVESDGVAFHGNVGRESAGVRGVGRGEVEDWDSLANTGGDAKYFGDGDRFG